MQRTSKMSSERILLPNRQLEFPKPITIQKRKKSASIRVSLLRDWSYPTTKPIRTVTTLLFSDSIAKFDALSAARLPQDMAKRENKTPPLVSQSREVAEICNSNAFPHLDTVPHLEAELKELTSTGLFMKLPAEIRCMIWAATVPNGRIVKVSNKLFSPERECWHHGRPTNICMNCLYSSQKQPDIINACFESREETSRRYVELDLGQDSAIAQKQIKIRFDIDTVFLQDCGMLLMYDEVMVSKNGGFTETVTSSKHWNSIQHIALDMVTFSCPHIEHPLKIIIDQLQSMESLKTVTMITEFHCKASGGTMDEFMDVDGLEELIRRAERTRTRGGDARYERHCINKINAVRAIRECWEISAKALAERTKGSHVAEAPKLMFKEMRRDRKAESKGR